MTVRGLEPADLDAWIGMRQALFEDEDEAEDGEAEEEEIDLADLLEDEEDAESGDDDMAARLGCSLAGGVPVVAEAPGSGGRAGEVEVPAGLCALAFSLRPFLALATLSSARTSAPVSAFGWPDWLLDLAWSCAMKRLISRTQRAARPPGSI